MSPPYDPDYMTRAASVVRDGARRTPLCAPAPLGRCSRGCSRVSPRTHTIRAATGMWSSKDTHHPRCQGHTPFRRDTDYGPSSRTDSRRRNRARNHRSRPGRVECSRSRSRIVEVRSESRVAFTLLRVLMVEPNMRLTISNSPEINSQCFGWNSDY